jgi:phosphoenolpyruvate carboxylase
VRPAVDDEREHVGFYLVQVLYRVIPVLYESLQQALRDTYGEELPLPRLLRFGTWVGGDMDGNPNVDAHTIRNTLDAQRQAVLGRYQKELLQLASLLSQSTERVGVSDALQARVAHTSSCCRRCSRARAMPTCRTACSTTACAHACRPRWMTAKAPTPVRTN